MREQAIETRHLKIFVTVYKARSFTKAAEKLFTSQPTVSEHMQNLEARLNCKLFDRLGRSILPTAEAEILYPRAIAILEDLQRLEEEISATGKNVGGELILGASTIPGAYILPGVAASFKHEFPDISFEIQINDSAKIVEAVAGNELLLGVVGAKISSSKVRYQSFAEDELILAAAQDNPAPAEITLQELCHLPFIIRERGSGTRKSTEVLLARQQQTLSQLNICATLGSSAAVKEAIKANLGVSVISRHAIQDELTSGKIKEIHIPGLTMKRNFYVVTPTRRTLPNHYQELLRRLLGK
ncbi:LysR family transcriptional regulator [Desulfopila sp. IMCC35006]|uniref:selenium metabolism-associated LysR family transcriptional regulator n=1 Tax=Desulfopila sp. IMCC35006 TaxID=2569542 RepID=UPI0010ABBC20|nr:selenium metabolism-associated LysR family transcriptional regulator [Desulfopila sp. IMCC35006]TKB28291.1 LysR family transcriptional regulator [Desulfopila sp. IMCC35006]